MQISIDTVDGYAINAYTPDAITIGNKSYQAPLALSPQTIMTPWSTDSIEDLIALAPEVILFGTGQSQDFYPQLAATLSQQGIGFESMPSQSACSTYNILAAEGRRVVLALLA